MDLRKVWAIAVREFGSYFVSPIVYGFLTGYIFLLGYFNLNMMVRRQQAEFNLALILFVFLLFTPLLTMRLISNERATGTIEFILTSPVRASEFVLGKYLAALGVYGVSLILPWSFRRFSSPLGIRTCRFWLRSTWAWPSWGRLSWRSVSSARVSRRTGWWRPWRRFPC